MMTTPKGQRFGSIHGPCSPGITFCGNIVSVLVDGVEVMGRCYAFNEPGGFADCYRENENGKKYCWLTRGGEAKVPRERLFGVVEMRLEGES